MSLTLNTTGVTIVDDGDPSIIYQGHWQKGGVAAEHNSTTHGTNLSGSSATFIFNGTSVAVYGTFAAGTGPTSTYNLDDFPLITYHAVTEVPPVYNLLFYQSPALSAGSHRLVITCVGNSTRRLWLDYLLYIPTPGSPTLTPTAGPSPTVIRTSNSKVAGAVGGSLGGLLLLVVFTAALYFKRLKRQTPEIDVILSETSNPRLSLLDPFPHSQQRYPHHSLAPPPSKAIRLYVLNPSSPTTESGRVTENPVAIAGSSNFHGGQSPNDRETDFPSQLEPSTVLSPVSTVPVNPHVYPTQPISEQDEPQTIDNNLTNRMNVSLPSDAVIDQEIGLQFSQNEEASNEDLFSLDIPPPYNRY